MEPYRACTIKSFKHDGSLHRAWLENWIIPASALMDAHRKEKMVVAINDATTVVESSGHTWTSRVPGVVFFMPGKWYNVVALLEKGGVRYYCNVASPPYMTEDVITYIDYDLDVMVHKDGKFRVMDRDEYEQHRYQYRYGRRVRQRIQAGLRELLDRLEARHAPFDDGIASRYYEQWCRQAGER